MEPERQIPYQLDARGDVTAVLPPAVVFFLSILPAASSFNGQSLPIITDTVAHPTQDQS